MRAFLAAAFEIAPPLVRGEAGRARTAFAGDVLIVPADAAVDLELAFARAAHLASHLAFGGPLLKAAGLAPLQIALVSLLEDARVERLAIEAMPGLARLFLARHCPPDPHDRSAEGHLRRLARGLLLLDAGGDHWVDRAVSLFRAGRPREEGPALSLRIGALLGRDLGQMRVRFDPARCPVEPDYRDDHAGLWQFEDRAARIEALPSSSGAPDAPDAPDAGGGGRDEPAEALPPAGAVLARLPEWDRLIRCERPDWTRIVEGVPPAQIGPRYARAGRTTPIGRAIGVAVRRARLGRVVRERHRPDGDTLDLDRAIEALCGIGRGGSAEPRVFLRPVRRRDLSMMVLLDASASTADRHGAAGRSILETEIEAVDLLSAALADTGDPFTLAAFCSNGRKEVRWFGIKSFVERYDDAAAGRLGRLVPHGSTRLGAALRYAGRALATRRSHRRVLLVLTDGEPSDVDIADPRYLIEDSRHAAAVLARRGIDCIAVRVGAAPGSSPDDRPARMFGRRRTVQVGAVEQLPGELARLYRHLAG